MSFGYICGVIPIAANCSTSGELTSGMPIPGAPSAPPPAFICRMIS